MRILLSIIVIFSFLTNCYSSQPDILEPQALPKSTSTGVSWINKFAHQQPMKFTIHPNSRVDLRCTEVLIESYDLDQFEKEEEKKSSLKRNAEKVEEQITPLLSPRKQGRFKSQVMVNSELKVLPALTMSSFRDRSPQSFIAENGTTVVFVDLDRTAMQNKYLLFQLDADWQDEILNSFYEEGNFDGSAEDFQLFKRYIATTQDCLSPYCKQFDEELVEEQGRKFLSGLSEDGAIVIGLTARKFLIADKTDTSLRSLGIHFDQLSGLGNFSIDHHMFKFQNGVCYTGNIVKKFQVIPTLLKQVVHDRLNKKGPYFTYHFDDSETEIQAFETENTPGNPTVYRIIMQPVFYNGFEKLSEPKLALLNAGDNAEIYREIDEEFFYGGFEKWLLQEHGRKIKKQALVASPYL
jgi:hypothetical protein